jgi:hypothetical protein
MAFVAVTVNVYEVPPVSPVTVIGDDAAVPVIELGLDVAVKPVIAEPPSSAGAVKVTVASRSVPAVAVPIVGAPGTVFGKGHKPAATFCMACSNVHTPGAAPVFPPVVAGGDLVIKPPMYLLDMANP